MPGVKSSRRVGFRTLRFLIRLFIPVWRVVWLTDEPADEPCVFTCNHANTVGPVVMSVYFTRPARPWIIDKMLSVRTMPAYLRSDFFHAKTRVGLVLYAILSVIMAPFALGAVRCTRPISASSGNGASVTIRESVESLISGDDNVIFPEYPGKEAPPDGSCGELQSGFLHTAPAYFQASGRTLPFYPVAICEEDHTIRVGAPVKFDDGCAFSEQKAHITHRLRADITALMRMYLVPLTPAQRK